MTRENKIKFSIVGYGFIGKKHEFFIKNNPSSELVAIIDSLETNEDINYSSINEFIANDKQETDVVCIATPNNSHAANAKQLIKAGYHVVIEKPMALHKVDALEIVSLAEYYQKQVFVVMQNRYSPVSLWLKQIIDSGMLGAIYFTQVNCFWNRDERYYGGQAWQGKKELDGGSLFTQFSHFVDLLYWCFGDIKDIRSNFYDFNHAHLTDFEDSGVSTFEFVSGGIGQFNFSTSCYNQNLESTITVLAEHGSIKIGGQYMDRIEQCIIKGEEVEMPKDSSEVFGKYKGNSANHRFIIQNVINTLRNQEEVTTNAKDGLMVVDMIERMYSA